MRRLLGRGSSLVRVQRVEIACFEGQKIWGGGRRHESCPLAIKGFWSMRLSAEGEGKVGRDIGLRPRQLVDPLGPFVGSEIGRVSDLKVGR